ncbi:MAG: hypothetical protein RIS94_3239 [Pseudomonadota bacterium]|jgi:short-subunit dehydrogenase
MSSSICLVTGASSGIGEAFAEALATRGHALVLVARRADRLATLADRLQQDHGVAVECLTADLAEDASLARVEARLAQGDIAMLVNNAGVGDIGLFADMPRATHQRMIAVNVTALTCLAHAATQAMLANGGGIIINVASGFAYDFMPGAAVYAATKAYVAQFTEVLDAELGERGIQMQALVPGLTRTELGGAADSGLFDLFPPHAIMSARAVAEASLSALALGELVCIPRLEDHAHFTQARAAMRAVGRDPDHNRVATRYGVDLT